MQHWYERDPQRLHAELLAGERAGERLRWIWRHDGLVGWEGLVEVQDRQHFLRIVYPPEFPMAPPRVVETEPFTDNVVDDRSTYHQLLDGSLCLYTVGRGARSWSPSYTVAHVIERYREYRELANARAHVNEHDNVPELAGLPGPMTLAMSPGQVQVMNMPGGRGQLDIAWSVMPLLGVVGKLTSRNGLTVPMDITPWQQCGVVPLAMTHGVWLRVPSETMKWNELRTRADVEALVSQALPRLHRKRALAANVLVLARGDAQTPGNLLAIFHAQLPGMPDLSALPLLSSIVKVVDLDARLFARVDSALAGRKLLANARVAIVGAGSLGSSVAVHLARSGVLQFDVFDPEYLEPENILRHAGDLTSLYHPKVAVVDALIRRRNPFAQVRIYQSSPLWDGSRNAIRAFQELLDDPASLAIVTTADDQVERAINQMAAMSGMPVVYGSVLGAAEHGRIFRVIPGSTACYQCVLDAQERDPARFPFLMDARGAEHAGVHPYRQPGIPGLGLDIEQVALLTARLALQTLAKRLSVELGYPEAHGDHFLWTSRGGWEFDHPLQVRVESYPRSPECSVCSSGRPPVEDSSLSTEIRGLIKRMSDPVRMAENASL